MSTKVEVTCVSKKEIMNFDPKHPTIFRIELGVPYNPDSIYFQSMNGSKLELCTINQEAADMFKIGKKYEVLINPVKEDQ